MHFKNYLGLILICSLVTLNYVCGMEESLPPLEKLGLTERANLKFITSYNLIKNKIDADKANVPEEVKHMVKELKTLLSSNLSAETKKLLLNLLNNPNYVVNIKKIFPEKHGNADKQKVLDYALLEVMQTNAPRFFEQLKKAGANIDDLLVG